MRCQKQAQFLSAIFFYFFFITKIWLTFCFFQWSFSWYYKKLNDLKYKPFFGITNYTANVCNYLSNRNSMLVDMFMEDMKKHSNLVHECPFQVSNSIVVCQLNNNQSIERQLINFGDFLFLVFCYKSNERVTVT